MIRFLLGAVAASLVLYFYGFLYWGAGPYSQVIWKKAVDDEKAGQALLEHFPQRGVYFVPSVSEDMEKYEALSLQGPVAFVYMLRPEGRPAFDTRIMLNGFMLNFVVVLLVGGLLRATWPAAPTYLRRMSLAALVGVIAAMLASGGDVAWWDSSIEWASYCGFYFFSAIIVIAAVMTAIDRPPVPGSSTNHQTPPAST